MINYQAIRVIYKFEMLRAWHTLLQTIASPVISTSLYFVVFGAAIGSRIEEIEGVSYGVFIVPGLVLLSLLQLGEEGYALPLRRKLSRSLIGPTSTRATSRRRSRWPSSPRPITSRPNLSASV